MGIKNLNTLLKKHCQDSIIQVPFTKLKHRRIAIDALLWISTNAAVARKSIVNNTDVTLDPINENAISNQWMDAGIKFSIKFLKYNIIPVWVFDGESPTLKSQTKESRVQTKQQYKQKANELHESMLTNILTQSKEDISDLRKYLINSGFTRKEDIELFKNILDNIGIPVLTAKSEAEKLCSELAIEGRVCGVWSSDTDNLVCGCPVMFTCASMNKGVLCLDGRRLDLVLEGLGLNQEEFVDLCIMAGCDFNTNIPRVGIMRSYDLISRYGSIDELPGSLDISCLKHIEVRELFVAEKCEEGLCLDLDRGKLGMGYELLDLYGLGGNYGKLSEVFGMNEGECLEGVIDWDELDGDEGEGRDKDEEYEYGMEKIDGYKKAMSDFSDMIGVMG